jgi:hypothetical protein
LHDTGAWLGRRDPRDDDRLSEAIALGDMDLSDRIAEIHGHNCDDDDRYIHIYLSNRVNHI